MVFLTNTNTVILLDPYCGTITEPGLPVVNFVLFFQAFLVHWAGCDLMGTAILSIALSRLGKMPKCTAKDWEEIW